MTEVRVRIAPSPTGVPHIGNTRTALFNYLFARHEGGKFIVRIEDTDQARLVPGSMEKIMEILDWLGIDYDEGPGREGKVGPYLQSERLSLYKKYVQELITKNRAFEDDGAIRFKPLGDGESVWEDLIHGQIKFANKEVEPFVILKSDGFPTYHLANVIDDHLMGITHVLRGDEWISSTPKHLQIYEALGWESPQFGHLPLILGPDKAKLSKRHGAESVLEYRDQGYLREAIINFMVFLGWNPKTEQEIFSLDKLSKDFRIQDINKNSPVFDVKKLDWFNGKYMRELTDAELQLRLEGFIPQSWDEKKVNRLIPLVKDRITRLTEFSSMVGFVFVDQMDIKRVKTDLEKFDSGMVKKIVETFKNQLEHEWSIEVFEKTGRGLAEALELKVGEVFMVLRLVLAGSKVTPPLFETLEVMGKDKTLTRLDETLENLG